MVEKKREILKEFSLKHSRPGSINNHSGTSKRSATKKQVQPSGEVSTQVGNDQYLPGSISERALSSCLHPRGLTERVLSAVSFPTPAKVTFQVPQVSYGRFARPQLVENPSLSAAAQPYTPTVNIGRTSPLQRPSVVENPTVSEPHAYGHYHLNHEAVLRDKGRKTEVPCSNLTQPEVMPHSVPIVSMIPQHLCGEERKTATSNQLPNQVSGTVVHPYSISANSQGAPAYVAYLVPNHEAGSTLCNDNFGHTAQTQNTYPVAAECPARS